MDEELGRVWDDDFTKVIHVQTADDNLLLVLPDGDSMRLSLRSVILLRRMLQRYEASRN
jgi:hypothetical protein